MSQLRRPMIALLTLLNLTLLAVILWLAGHGVSGLMHKPKELPVIAELAAFELTREDGSRFSWESLKDHPWVADFIFTRCPNQCPLMSSRFASLQKSLPKGVKLVSFSVDPEFDTPDVLKSYAKQFGADPALWVFLTGDKTTIREIQKQMKLSTDDDPGMHSLRFVLVDGEGRVRGYYDSTAQASPQQLLKDLRRVAK